MNNFCMKIMLCLILFIGLPFYCAADDLSGTLIKSNSKGETKLMHSFVLAEKPSNPKDIKSIIKDGNTDLTVTAYGLVGDIESKFAAFRLIAPCLAPNAEKQCKKPALTPCCSKVKQLLSDSAMVEFRDNNGKLIRESIANCNNITPNAKAFVTGKLIRNEGGAYVIDAHGIYIEP